MEEGSVWLCSFSVLLNACVYFYPALTSSPAVSLQLLRAFWFRMRFYAVLFILFNQDYKEVTPWVVDLCFPLVRINIWLLDQLFAVEMPGYMELWNCLLVAEFLAINFLIYPRAYSFAANAIFSTLQSADIQLTICWVFCKWTVPESFWPCVIPFSLSIQWLLLCGVLPCAAWLDYKDWIEPANSITGRFWREGNNGQMWLIQVVQLSLWILWLQVCSMWFGASLAVQSILSAVGVWLLVWVHGQFWFHQERVVNLLIEDMYEGLWWALLIWVPLQHPLILAAILLFSARKFIYH